MDLNSLIVEMGLSDKITIFKLNHWRGCWRLDHEYHEDKVEKEESIHTIYIIWNSDRVSSVFPRQEGGLVVS